MSATVRCIVVLLVAALSGCATFRGAPELPFDGDKVFGKDEIQNVLKELADSNTTIDETDRDERIIKLIASVDIKYTEFKQQFMANRQHAGSLSDAMTLAMTVAGSLTSSAGVKNNYLQGIALVRGGAENYDKNYLLTQTVHALVAQMDANRKGKLEDIYEKMNRRLDEYPAMAAYNDVLDYYHAGTVLGAIVSIQSDAKEKENVASRNLGEVQTRRQQRLIDSQSQPR
jgi:hypothetical protein